jgi:hypothetical protein
MQGPGKFELNAMGKASVQKGEAGWVADKLSACLTHCHPNLRIRLQTSHRTKPPTKGLMALDTQRGRVGQDGSGQRLR